MSELLLGIDIGSYSSKGVLCRADGTLIAEARMPHEITFPKPGYAEHDAEKVWWHDFSFIARELVNKAPRIDQIIAVGVSGVGPCILPVDNTGKPCAGYPLRHRHPLCQPIDYLEDFYTKKPYLNSAAHDLPANLLAPKFYGSRIMNQKFTDKHINSLPRPPILSTNLPADTYWICTQRRISILYSIFLQWIGMPGLLVKLLI